MRSRFVSCAGRLARF